MLEKQSLRQQWDDDVQLLPSARHGGRLPQTPATQTGSQHSLADEHEAPSILHGGGGTSPQTPALQLPVQHSSPREHEVPSGRQMGPPALPPLPPSTLPPAPPFPPPLLDPSWSRDERSPRVV